MSLPPSPIGRSLEGVSNGPRDIPSSPWRKAYGAQVETARRGSVMKALAIMMVARLVVILSFLALLSGCYASSKLIQIPDNPDSIAKSVENDKKSKLPAFVSSINVKRNSGSANPSTEFERRFLGHLNQTNYFSDVVNGTVSRKPEPPYIDVNLDVNEHMDNNSVSNGIKGFFTGATFLLLAPVLPAEYGFDTSFTLHARWATGIEKAYKASCAASASGTFPYQEAKKEFNAAIGNCTERCLNSVLNQLTSDRIQAQ